MSTISLNAGFDNLSNPVNVRDPFPLYAWLRDNSPVHRIESTGGYLLTRYEHVRAAFLDTTLFSSRSGAALEAAGNAFPSDVREDFAIGFRFFYQQIQAFDAPTHTRQRALITKAFSARVIETMRERIQRRIDALLNDLEKRGQFDFVADFAYPLPSLVIFDLLGVPEQYYSAMRASADAFARFLPAVLAGDVEGLQRIGTALRETEGSLRRLLAEKRRDPEVDLLSALAAVRDEEAGLSDDDIVVLSNFLLFAGHETTANLLSGSVLQLLRQRDLWRELCAAPDRVPSVIDELLRFVSPVLTLGRLVTDDVEMHGTRIPKGTRVSLVVGAANHDPAQFEEPEQLSFTRQRTGVLAFGHGVHYCIGAMLARTEAELALRAVVERMPDLQLLNNDPEYQPVFYLRALKALPVANAASAGRRI